VTSYLIGVVIGLIVGWNFFPRPQWVKILRGRIRFYFKILNGESHV